MVKKLNVTQKVTEKVTSARENNPSRFDSIAKKGYGFLLTVISVPLMVTLKITWDALDTDLKLFAFSFFISIILGLLLFCLILAGVSVKIYFSQTGKVTKIEATLKNEYEQKALKERAEYESKLAGFNENFAVSLAAIMSQTNQVFMSILSGKIQPDKDKLREIYVPSAAQFATENATLPRLKLIEVEEELEEN